MYIQYSIEYIDRLEKLKKTRERIFLGSENIACLEVRN